jgi:molybdopterin molybdotransferase
MTVRQSWKTIEQQLREHAPEISRRLSPPASAESIARLESTLKRRLPADFKESLAIHNGISQRTAHTPLVNNDCLCSTTEIAREWRMMKKLMDDGHFDLDGEPGCPDTRTRKIKNDAWWRTGWIPFTESDGNKFVIDLDPPKLGKKGQIFYFWNSGHSPREVVASSYADWLAQLANHLQRGRFQVIRPGYIEILAFL